MPAKAKAGVKTRGRKSGAGKKAAPTKGGRAAAATPLKVVKKGYDYFGKGDIAGVISLYADNATFIPQMGLEGKSPLVTPKGTFSKSEMGGFFAALAQELEFTRWENRQWVADGKTVIVLGYYAGTNKRTGKPFKSEFCHALTVERGKVTSFKEFTDTAAALEAAR
jgi:ketosteroid isomerase-like protein